MASELEDVRNCCLALGSHRLTERKKEAVRLGSILQREHVRILIDQQSVCRNKSTPPVTWDFIFKSIRGAVLQDIETSVVKSSSKGASILANLSSQETLSGLHGSCRPRKRKDIHSVDLLRAVLRQSGRENPLLDGRRILQHIAEVLRIEDAVAIVGRDYSDMLLKHVLPLRKYWRDFSQELCNEMLEFYCRSLVSPVPSVSTVAASRVILALVDGMNNQFSELPTLCLQSISDYIMSSKEARSMQVIASVLASINVWCHSIAVTGTRQVCELGQRLGSMLLHLWKGGTTEVLKMELIDFFRLQLAVRPVIDHVEKDWESVLSKLFDQMYSEIKNPKFRGKLLTRDAQLMLNAPAIGLLADVSWRLCAKAQSSVGATQASSHASEEPSVKKARLTSSVRASWELLRSLVTDVSDDRAAQTWLAVLERLLLLEQQRLEMGDAEVLQFVGCLLTHLSQSKRSDLYDAVSRCLCSLARLSARARLGSNASELWNKVVRQSAGCIQRGHHEFFSVIQIIIECNLASCDEISLAWKPCFAAFVRLPSRTAVHWLRAFLHAFEFRSQLVGQILRAIDDSGNLGRVDEDNPKEVAGVWEQELQRRRQKYEQQEDFSSRSTSFAVSDLCPVALADCLVALLSEDFGPARDPSSIETVSLAGHTASCCRPRDADSGHQQLRCLSEPALEKVTATVRREEAAKLGRLGNDTCHRHTDDCNKSSCCTCDLLSPIASPCGAASCCTAVGHSIAVADGQSFSLVDAWLRRLAVRTRALLIAEVGPVSVTAVIDSLWICTLVLHMLPTISSMRSTGPMVSCSSSPAVPNHPWIDIAQDLWCRTCDRIQQSMEGDAQAAGALVQLVQSSFSQLSNNQEAVLVSATPANFVEALRAAFETLMKKSSNEAFRSISTVPAVSANEFSVLDDESCDGDSGSTTDDDADASDGYYRKLAFEQPLGYEANKSDSQLLAERCLLLLSSCLLPASATTPPLQGHLAISSDRCVTQILRADYWNFSKMSQALTMLEFLSGIARRTYACVDVVKQSLDVMMALMKQYCQDMPMAAKLVVLLSQFALVCVRSPGVDTSLPTQLEWSECIQQSKQLLTAMWTVHAGSHLSHELHMELVRCTSLLLMVSDKLFSVDEQSDDSDSCHDLYSHYLSALCDARSTIRLCAVQHMSCLFHVKQRCTPPDCKKRPLLPRTSSVQGKVVDDITLKLDQYLSGASDLARAHKGQDAGQDPNLANCLLTYTAIARFGDSFCRSRTLSIVLLMQKKFNIRNEVVSRILQEMVDIIGCEDVVLLLENNLPYILQEWLAAGFSLSDFPHYRLQVSRVEQFFRNYKDTIIGAAFVSSCCGCKRTEALATSALASVSAVLNLPVDSALEQSLTYILALLLPVIAARSLELIDDNRGKHGLHAYRKLVERFSERKINHCIVRDLDRIIVLMLRSECDGPELGVSTGRFTQGEHSAAAVFDAALDYMEKHVPKDHSVAKLVISDPVVLHQIVLDAAACLDRTRRSSSNGHSWAETARLYRTLVERLASKLSGKVKSGIRRPSLLGALALHQLASIATRELQHAAAWLCRTDERRLPCAQVDGGSPRSDVAVSWCSPVVNVASTGCCSMPSLCAHSGAAALACLDVLTWLWTSATEVEHEPCVVPIMRRLATSVEDAALRIWHNRGLRAKVSELLQLIRTRDARTVSEVCIEFLSLPRYFELSTCRNAAFPTNDELVEIVDTLADKCSSTGRKLAALCRVSRHLPLQLSQENAEGFSASSLAKVTSGMLHVLRNQRFARSTPTVGHLVTHCLARMCAGRLREFFVSLPTQEPLPPRERTQLYDFLLTLLFDLTSNVSVQVSGAAYCALKKILSTSLNQVPGDVTEQQLSSSKAALPGAATLSWRLLEPLFKPNGHSVGVMSHNPTKRHDTCPHDGDLASRFESQSLWCTSLYTTANQWLLQQINALADSGCLLDEFLSALLPVCKVKDDLCKEIFPVVLGDALASCPAGHLRKVVSQKITQLLLSSASAFARRQHRLEPSAEQAALDVTTDICKSLLVAVQYLRMKPLPKAQQTRSAAATPWDSNFWLDIDFSLLARIAFYCRSYFMCIMFSEIYYYAARDKNATSTFATSTESFGLCSSKSMPTTACEPIAPGSNSVGSLDALVIDAYCKIGDPDAAYGCGLGQGTEVGQRLQQYEHEGLWEQALAAHDERMNEAPAVSAVDRSADSRQDGVCSNQLDAIGVMRALRLCGLQHILRTYSSHSAVGHASGKLCGSTELEEFMYDHSWRTATWDAVPEVRSRRQTQPFAEIIFSGLCGIRQGCAAAVEASAAAATTNLLAFVRQESCSVLDESVHALGVVWSRLACAAVLQDAAAFLRREISSQELDLRWDCLAAGFQESDSSSSVEEPAKNLIVSVLDAFVETSSSAACGGRSSSVCSMSPHLHQILYNRRRSLLLGALRAGRFEVARRLLTNLKENFATFSGEQWCTGVQRVVNWRLDEARVCWEAGERDRAIRVVRDYASALGSEMCSRPDQKAAYAEALLMLGGWLGEMRTASPRRIADEHMGVAARLLDELSTAAHGDSTIVSGRVDAHAALAAFADQEYQRIVAYIKSPIYEERRAVLEEARRQMELLSRSSVATTRDRLYLRSLASQSNIDEAEVKAMLEDRRHYLVKAISHYATSLKISSAHDLKIFRLVSLWFENEADASISNLIETLFRELQSLKFLPLVYQLAARMNLDKSSSFVSSSSSATLQRVLQATVERTARDHPYHAVSTLLALANATQTAGDGGLGGGIKKRKVVPSSVDASTEANLEGRTLAARRVLEAVKRSRLELIAAMQHLSDAYIALASADVLNLKGRSGPFKLSGTMRILSSRELAGAPVLTRAIRVDASGTYRDVVLISSFNDTFHLAGGVNLPKIIVCIGSDGKQYRQLVKGKDDLRQDAVMQQVFDVVNVLLQADEPCRQRRLRLRTYKVVPLSCDSGLLEWCEGTMPLGEYLIGSSAGGDESLGAHARYRPGDWKAFKCRKLLLENKGAASDRLLHTYATICENFQPVFRHFFMEKFPYPSEWYERRLAYCRSTSVNSIVGYFLGIGDRHLQNILIDCYAADLVLIDFGVAFEQGRILPTPETVPFRLTRDIVDGFGPMGVEGTFRRCCERTAQVMRQSRDTILAIVQVLLVDPLTSWTLSPDKILDLQREKLVDSSAESTAARTEQSVTAAPKPPNGSEGLLDCVTGQSRCSLTRCGGGGGMERRNQMAERVVLRLRQKLMGYVDDVHLSVSGHVNHLIQEAIDAKNLSRIYPGWQPYV